jgi:hypothetical protein
MKYTIKKVVENKSKNYVLLEVEPTSRTLKINVNNYHLNLPKMLFKIEFFKIGDRYNFCDLQIFFFDKNDNLVSCPFPNVAKLAGSRVDGTICLGHPKNIEHTSLNDLIQELLHMFFTIPFIDFTNYSYKMYNGESQKFFLNWAKTKIMPEYTNHIVSGVEL